MSGWSDGSDKDPYGVRTGSPETAANTLLCLVNRASFLLGRQLWRLEENFMKNGGFTERLYQTRKQAGTR